MEDIADILFGWAAENGSRLYAWDFGTIAYVVCLWEVFMVQPAVVFEKQMEYYAEVMKSYIETAKSFTQLSAAALLLPIAFFRQLLAWGQTRPVQVDLLLALTWLCFLVATGAGLLYQYLAVKYLSAHYFPGDWKDAPWIVKRPGNMYGVMIGAFFLGAVLFVIKAFFQLRALGHLT